jgi:ssDNA-binding Zn-finger/Zn-ribbon topoisomerase 1
MWDISSTEEKVCPDCGKPLMLAEITSEGRVSIGCHCPGRVHDALPEGAVLTDIGGVWVVRCPKEGMNVCSLS